LSEKELKLIQRLAKEEDKEKSSEARELILDGIKYKMLVGYRQGKVSLGTLTKKLGLSLRRSIFWRPWESRRQSRTTTISKVSQQRGRYSRGESNIRRHASPAFLQRPSPSWSVPNPARQTSFSRFS
jgi:hypothetical protein